MLSCDTDSIEQNKKNTDRRKIRKKIRFSLIIELLPVLKRL
jgi:hypothetical protein